MRIELLLQISMATLTALGTLLLGMGEREVTLPLIAMIVSASSVYLTDVSGWLRLNTRVANIAGSTAVVIFVWDFLHRYGSETQLLAVANLLIYLQFVLLYQQKSDSTYWLLALLSLLQVAVATALNFELMFGVVLLLYVVTGLITLGLFLLYRESRHCRQRDSDLSRLPAVLSSRWPLPLGAGAIDSSAQPEAVFDHVGWRFARQMSALSASTVACALLVFFLVPRVNETRWRAPNAQVQNTIGATNEVSLDEFGPILDNPEVVMQVELYEGDSYRPYSIKEAPLFRGPCLTNYSKKKWHQATRPSHPERVREIDASPRGYVRQVIRMKPLDTDSVFCVIPVAGVKSTSDEFNLDPFTQQIYRMHSAREQTVEVYTSGFVNGRQSTLIAEEQGWQSLNRYQEYPSASLRRLTTLSQALVAGVDGHIAQARLLTNYLHDSSLYRYSLNAPKRNPAIDPVEDFLFEHQEGHCEYFASALALMLRAVDIPSRMVLGFNGGEWNPIGGFFQVRHLHSHAWVEAYIAAEQLPENLRRGFPHGAWLTLDPTPGTSGAVSRVGPTPGLPSFRQVLDYARYLWSSYIMALDSDRQLRLIYMPVLRNLATSARTLWDAAWHRPRRAALFFAGLSLLCLLIALLLVRGHRLWRRLTRVFAAGSARNRRRRLAPVVEFYRQLESALAGFGLVRAESLTQSEFAQIAALRLGSLGLPAPAVAAPTAVCDAFYAVRFGHQSLDKTQLEAVEQSLAALRAAARQHNAGGWQR